jgi:hypothetical protein
MQIKFISAIMKNNISPQLSNQNSNKDFLIPAKKFGGHYLTHAKISIFSLNFYQKFVYTKQPKIPATRKFFKSKNLKI